MAWDFPHLLQQGELQQPPYQPHWVRGVQEIGGGGQACKNKFLSAKQFIRIHMEDEEEICSDLLELHQPPEQPSQSPFWCVKNLTSSLEVQEVSRVRA